MLFFERSVFHNTIQQKSESIEQSITCLRKLTLHCEYGDSTGTDLRSSHSHLQFNKTEKKIIDLI